MTAIPEQTALASVIADSKAIEARLVHLFRLMNSEQKKMLLSLCDATLSGQLSGHWDVMSDDATLYSSMSKHVHHHLESILYWASMGRSQWNNIEPAVRKHLPGHVSMANDIAIEGWMSATQLRDAFGLHSCNFYAENYPWGGSQEDARNYRSHFDGNMQLKMADLAKVHG